MASFKSFFGSSSSIKIEVEGGDGGSSNAYAPQFLEAIRSVAIATAGQIASLPEGERPSEVEVSYGLKALREGGFAVGLGGDANFRVHLKWGGSEEGGGLLAGLPGLPEDVA